MMGPIYDSRLPDIFPAFLDLLKFTRSQNWRKLCPCSTLSYVKLSGVRKSKVKGLNLLTHHDSSSSNASSMHSEGAWFESVL